MISAPPCPLSPSLHLIISPNIITYSEALKRQTITWRSNIHQESASSLKILIKHAQCKHADTHHHTHTRKLIQLSEKCCPVVLTSFPSLSHIVFLSGFRCCAFSKSFVTTTCMEFILALGCSKWKLQGVFCLQKRWVLQAEWLCVKRESCWPEKLYIMLSTVRYPDNFPPGIQHLNYPHLVAMLVSCFWSKSLARKECFSIVSQ